MDVTKHTSQFEWLDLKSAEQSYPFSKRTLWAWIAQGKLPAYKPFKRKTLVRRTDIEKILAESRVGVDLDQVVDEAVRDLA